jgi:transposase
MPTPKKSRSRSHPLRTPRQHHPDAAGIDIGGSSHYVAVPADRDPQPVRSFGAFTEDLFALSDWLSACRITTVAMEATGVYWIPLFEILERRGFEVVLVNARHVKNVPGRKSDVIDCQWLQELHAMGLLSASFRPSDPIVALRSLVRQRKMLVEYAASHVQHIQKALVQMNIQLQNVVTDVTGVTGMKIIRDILRGERDPKILAAHRDYRCKSTTETIEKSLIGNWRDEHLFTLGQAVELNDFYEHQIVECDRVIAAYSAALPAVADAEQIPPSSKRRKTLERNEPQFDARGRAYQLVGVDLTQIDGIRGYTALQLIAEIGTDMSRWKTASHFASWLALCPGTNITGGRRRSGRQPRKAHRAASILRMAAISIRNSRTALGAFFRRKRSQLGPARAIVATAHKLARLIYTLIKDRRQFTEPGESAYELQHRERAVRSLKRKAQSLGFDLTKIAAEGAVS